MGENRTEAYSVGNRAHREMIICMMLVIGQKQLQSGVLIILASSIHL